MKISGRVLVLVLSLVLFITMLGGCGSTGKDPTEVTVQSSEGPSSSESGNDYTKEVLELSLWNSLADTITPVTEDIISPELTKRTGVKWKTVEGNNGVNVNQRFNVMVQSGEIPDVMWVTNNQPGIWSKCKENDLTYSLTMDDFSNYAPEIAKRLDPVVLAASLQPDKTLYGIPSWIPLSEYDKQQNPNFAEATNDWQSWMADYSMPLVRDDILKQIFPDAKSFEELADIVKKNGELTKEDVIVPGLETQEDLVEFLRKVKDLDLMQDGKPVMPFGADTDFFQYMMGEIGGLYTATQGIDFYNNNTGKYDLYYEKPEFKSMLAFWNSAAREGLLDPNYIVMKREQKAEKIQRGEYALISTWLIDGKTLNAACATFERPYRYRQLLLPIKVTKYYPGFSGCSSSAAAYYLINKQTVKKEDLPKVLNFFNYYLTPEGGDLVSWGPESAGLWEIGADGKKNFKTKELQDSSINWIYSEGSKDTRYYGLVDGNTGNDCRHYILYMAANNLSMPRLQDWPLPLTGTEDDVFNLMGKVDRHTQSWQIDAIWQGSTNKPYIDAALQKFSPARDKVLQTIIPNIIFAKSESDFDKYYQEGLDTFYVEGDYPTFRDAMDKGAKEFLDANPDLKPLEWPVK